MGGDLIRQEPADHTTLLGDQVCLPIFQANGWTNYMLKFSTQDEELALEFLQTLKDSIATGRGCKGSILTRNFAKIMEFPLAGEEFSEAMDPVMARAQFLVHTDPQLQINRKKGTI